MLLILYRIFFVVKFIPCCHVTFLEYSLEVILLKSSLLWLVLLYFRAFNNEVTRLLAVEAAFLIILLFSRSRFSKATASDRELFLGQMLKSLNDKGHFLIISVILRIFCARSFFKVPYFMSPCSSSNRFKNKTICPSNRLIFIKLHLMALKLTDETCKT